MIYCHRSPWGADALWSFKLRCEPKFIGFQVFQFGNLNGRNCSLSFWTHDQQCLQHLVISLVLGHQPQQRLSGIHEN